MALLYATPFEESSIGRVLFDIRRVTLLGGIHFGFCLRRVSAHFGVVTGAFVASVGGRHGRHFIVT
jgi:hypothetical protein